MANNREKKAAHLYNAYALCRDALVRSLLKMCVRREDVDDILQETFLRVLNANNKTQIKSPQDYLFVVSRNLVIERLSLRAREINMEINDALVGADQVSQDRNLHYKQKFEAFNEALCRLPEKKRHAILLRKFYGLSHDEIAKKMNVSVSSIEKYIATGVTECRRKLRSKGYGVDSFSDGQKRMISQEAESGVGRE